MQEAFFIIPTQCASMPVPFRTLKTLEVEVVLKKLLHLYIPNRGSFPGRKPPTPKAVCSENLPLYESGISQHLLSASILPKPKFGGQAHSKDLGRSVHQIY